MTRTPVRLTARSRQATSRVASTSRTRWNWGAVVQLWVMRSTMTRQMVPTRGAPAGAAAATRAGAGGGAAGRAAAVRTSAVRTAPPGPEPRSALTSTPRSAASRRAFGDAGREARGRPVARLPGVPPLDEGEDVRLLDAPSARRHLGDVDAVLLGDLPRQGGYLRRRGGGAGAATRGSRSGPRADRSRWRGGLDGTGLVGSEDERDRLADGDDVARLRGHLAQDAGSRRLDLDGRLVGLDLEERVALPDRIAGRPEPLQDLAGVLRQLEGRHDDAGRHQAPLQRASAASKTVFSVGTVRSSSTGENGTGTSIAPMRLTGASR